MIVKDTPLKEVLKLTHPCKCNACEIGCEYGSGFLIGEDSKNIARFLNITEKELKEKFLEEVEQFNTKLLRPKLERKDNKPYGKCIFFDERGCKVHKVKPLQCKVSMGCKEYGEQLTIWFMLNHEVNTNDPESIRQYNIYLKSGGKTLKGGELESLVPDKQKLKKIIENEN